MFGFGIRWSLAHISRMGNEIIDGLARMWLASMNFIEFI